MSDFDGAAGCRRIAITGIRGIPAQHGGFETFAEALAPYLREREWEVTVYCQECREGAIEESEWQGIRLVRIPVRQGGALGTVLFDWRSLRHVADAGYDIVLTLGYNTALFNLLLIKGIKNVINMDGIEWKRRKWRWYEKAWLWLNEKAACWVATQLVADHPGIREHLVRSGAGSNISVIGYGARYLESGDATVLARYGVVPGRYAMVVARPEPENSILEIVSAFSRRPREFNLLVLGDYPATADGYRRAVREKAGAEVLFPGAIYERAVIDALRYYSRLYIHGHTVGGTNPSLVEALGAGSPVLAHDNIFNRWVAGEGARFFAGEEECARMLDEILDDEAVLETMRQGSRARFKEEFRWEVILDRYGETFDEIIGQRQ